MSEASNPIPGSSTIEWHAERAHSSDSGLIVVPVAGPAGTPAVAIRVHAGIERESIFWASTREGGAPIVPSWKSFIVGGNPNRVFLKGQRSATLPSPKLGGHFFVISGVYEYGILQQEGLDSNFVLGKMPWETDIDPNVNFIPALNFDPSGVIGTKTPSQVTEPITFDQPIQGYTPRAR